MSKIVKEGLTFDDVLLIPQASEVLPSQVDLHTTLTAGINLNIPIISAAMDTVTESRLAIAMAREGGMGIIHKNMSIEEQAKEVDKVKRSEHGVITDPFYLEPQNLVKDAVALMERYRISGVPITKNGKLVGILTNRDLRFETNFEQPIENVMTKENLVTAPVGTSLADAQKILGKHRIEKLPIVDEKGYLKGLITIKDIEKSIQYPNSARDKNGRLLVGAAVGTAANTMDRIAALIDAKVDIIAIDTAHGHQRMVLNKVEEIKKKYPNIPLIAGNVATAGAVEALADTGSAVELYSGYGKHIITALATINGSAVGIVAGRGGDNVPLLMEHLPREAEVFEGDVVVTSGYSQNHPSGIVIGTVKESSLDAAGLLRNATIEPAAVRSGMEEVFVVIWHQQDGIAK